MIRLNLESKRRSELATARAYSKKVVFDVLGAHLVVHALQKHAHVLRNDRRLLLAVESGPMLLHPSRKHVWRAESKVEDFLKAHS